MSSNYLEQLAVEWYEYRGFFVRRNVPVGQADGGGAGAELGIVAVAPGESRIVHLEASMDAHSWEVREQRFARKFAAGRAYLPDALGDFGHACDLAQFALVALGSGVNHPTLGGGKMLTLGEFLVEILADLRAGEGATMTVPQQFPMLRTLQFVSENGKAIVPVLLDQDPRQITF